MGQSSEKKPQVNFPSMITPGLDFWYNLLRTILLTFFISQLLGVPYLKLIGVLLILWIAVKLLVEGAPG